MKLRILLLVFLLVCVPCHSINGGDMAADGGFLIYYYAFDDQGNENWEYKVLYINEHLSEEDRAYKLFEYYFTRAGLSFVPAQAELYSVEIAEGSLTLSVSKHILNYGGTFYEQHMINQIIKTALAIPGVDSVTMLVENNLVALTEGGIIRGETHVK